MRKIVLALVLCFGLTGCAQLGDIVSRSTTASIANPVTREMLYDAENAAVIVFAGLRAYKKTCVEGAIPPSCRDVIRKIQVYTRRVPPLLDSTRRFVRNNDQVNAIIAYNAIREAMSNVAAIAQQNNVSIAR